ncbi:MAG: carboxypeptidase regulatory-like domain-containing protein [Isosphaeraceae bacterium]
MTAATILLAMMVLAQAQAPVSADLKPIPVAGVVVDSSDRPVAGAEVWLAPAGSLDEGRQAGMELWYRYSTTLDEGAATILVHGRSGEDGRFSLEVPAEVIAMRSPPPLAVWAIAGDGASRRVGFRRIPRVVLADDPPARVVVESPALDAPVVVRTPEGKPVGGARVAPSRAGDVVVPEPVAKALAASADAHGRVAIAGWNWNTPGEMRVEAPGWGVQLVRVPQPGPTTAGVTGMTGMAGVAGLLTLAPVGHIEGRLVAPDNRPIPKVTIRAASLAGGSAGFGVRGSASTTCDERGRFVIPNIAAGAADLALDFAPAGDFPLRGEAPRGLIVKAGEAVRVEVALRPTILVRGVIREKATKRPIAGVKVSINGQGGADDYAVTDAQGQYAGRVLRDRTQPFGWALRFPSPFYEPSDMAYPSQRMPRLGVDVLDQTPQELRRGVDVKGIIKGEDGQPLAGAEVEALWYGSEGQVQMALTRSDRSGGFILHGIDPIAELHLTAWDGRNASDVVTVRVESAAKAPIALTVGPGKTVPLGGRVVDAAGRPVAGASVLLRRQVRAKNGRIVVDEPVLAGDGPIVLNTDAEGRFRARGRYPSGCEYYAEAQAPGRLAARSTSIAVGRGQDRPITLVLRAIQAVEGRVLDRQGKPIAEAVVRQTGDGPMPTSAATDGDGHFRLEGVVEGPAAIVAEKAGFRAGFQSTDDIARPVDIVLARTDEPPIAAYRSIASVLAVDEEKTMARRLIEPLAARVLAKGDDQAKYRFLADAADIDPHATLEWLEEVKFGDAEYVTFLRQVLAAAMARESVDDAAAVLEASSSGMVKFNGYVALAETPNLPAARQRAFLDQALLHTKEARPLVFRVMGLGKVAERLVDLGDVERARAMLRNARAICDAEGKGPNGKGLRMQLTVPLSRVDLPDALRMLEELEQDARKTQAGDRIWVYGRQYLEIAQRAADRSPAEAERIVERADVLPILDRFVAPVCYKMARADVVRARRIALGRISVDSTNLGPYALGLMARAVAPKDSAEANRLLDEAFDRLGRQAGSANDWLETSDTVAAALLPVVERVAPERLGEFLARTILFRSPRGDQSGAETTQAGQRICRLALLAARYDRDLAARILRPELDRIGAGHETFGQDSVTFQILTALALVDPRRAVRLVEALPEDPEPGTDPYALKSRTRRSVAKVLALHGDDRWRDLFLNQIGLWTPEERNW